MDLQNTQELMTPVFNEHLRLCGYYMNKAYMQNMLLFVPIAILLGNMSFFMDIFDVNPEVSNLAQHFIWGTLPHVLFTALFEIHKVQLICYQKSFTQMLAQAAGTICHIPFLLKLIELLPDNPVLAIALATSASSLFKLIVISFIGLLHEDVRKSKTPFFTWKTFRAADSSSGFSKIEIPNLIMFITEGWTFQSLVLFSSFFSVEELAAQAFCTTISTSLFMISKGLSDASSSLIGNSMGNPDMHYGTTRAWRFASIISMTTIVYAMTALITLIFFTNEIISMMFVQNSKVKELTHEIMPIVFISFVMESMQL